MAAFTASLLSFVVNSWEQNLPAATRRVEEVISIVFELHAERLDRHLKSTTARVGSTHDHRKTEHLLAGLESKRCALALALTPVQTLKFSL